ncbi:histidine kinase dimerization/phospho-acceptor domain-containing protein [Actinoplanes oblitus]|uniref:histidine kinase n=1 Tax=Actinoplanes oblitus TaxID=3040509 RepID=A0ABY8W404_9ACTN|nr:histidine kinase dimerization/phospho-acceptor domain-containing protein [Actinoplanes oblitus]WIM92589.1 histidine kinase dimerization/phospho-acceptor domain-containing protein [Actinoplanes oblitus]
MSVEGSANGHRVAVGVPISTGACTIGALCVYGDRAEDPHDALTTLLVGIAAHVGQYLERRRAEELAVELARTKDEFLALVTHELRNPLAVIISTASLLEEELDGLLDADQRHYVHTIQRGAQRLSVMADDLNLLWPAGCRHGAAPGPTHHICSLHHSWSRRRSAPSPAGPLVPHAGTTEAAK